MSNETPSQIRLSDLPNRRETRILLEPDAKARAALAETLGISVIRKLRFAGSLSPVGRRDWHLAVDLGTTVVQPCVITLNPVTTRIDETVTRSYVVQLDQIEGEEVEMPEDETTERAPEILDLFAVMTEALALALPAYPRSEGAAVQHAIFTEPGKAPMTDEDTRPFAGLADLRNSLENKDE